MALTPNVSGKTLKKLELENAENLKRLADKAVEFERNEIVGETLPTHHLWKSTASVAEPHFEHKFEVCVWKADGKPIDELFGEGATLLARFKFLDEAAVIDFEKGLSLMYHFKPSPKISVYWLADEYDDKEEFIGEHITPHGAMLEVEMMLQDRMDLNGYNEALEQYMVEHHDWSEISQQEWFDEFWDSDDYHTFEQILEIEGADLDNLVLEDQERLEELHEEWAKDNHYGDIKALYMPRFEQSDYYRTFIREEMSRVGIGVFNYAHEQINVI
jgi:hypothetical protein